MFRCRGPSILALSAVLMCWLLRLAIGFDVSWIPSDPDGPLPQSTRYRQSLEKLCVLIKEKARLSPELQAKRAVLEKMCQRLEQDKRLLTGLGFPINRNIVGLALAIGGGAAMWVYREDLARIVRGFFRSVFNGKGNTQLLNDAKSLEALRQARLRRYQEASGESKDD